MHVNKAMITDVLKGELGFGGFVVTDYNGCFQAGVSGVSAVAGRVPERGRRHVHDLRRRHGVPQPFGTTSIVSNVRQLVESNTVPMSRLDDAVRRILAVKCEMGLFDTTGVIDSAATARVGSAAHRMVARQAVQKSLVVLKNDSNVLPLSKTATVALAGNSAAEHRQPVRRLDHHLAGRDGRRHPRRDQRADRDGGGDRHVEGRVFGQWHEHDRRGGRRRRDRRDAVFGGTGDGLMARPDLTIPAAQVAVRHGAEGRRVCARSSC